MPNFFLFQSEAWPPVGLRPPPPHQSLPFSHPSHWNIGKQKLFLRGVLKFRMSLWMPGTSSLFLLWCYVSWINLRWGRRLLTINKSTYISHSSSGLQGTFNLRDVRFNQCLRAYGIGVGRKDQTYKNGDYALFFAALIPLAIFKFKWISDRWIKNLPDLCIYLKSKTYFKKKEK